jgi:hypothetical protein
MRWAEEDVRKLVEKLTELSRGGSGAELTPKSVNVALAALRAYRDKLTSPRVTGAIVSFQIEALDGVGLPREVLATTVDEHLAHATLAKAKKQFRDQKLCSGVRPSAARESIRLLERSGDRILSGSSGMVKRAGGQTYARRIRRRILDHYAAAIPDLETVVFWAAFFLLLDKDCQARSTASYGPLAEV